MKGSELDLGEVFDRIQNELIQQIGVKSVEYLLQCMSMHPTQFIINLRKNVRQELIKQNTCPECHSDLENKACPKCKILYDEV